MSKAIRNIHINKYENIVKRNLAFDTDDKIKILLNVWISGVTFVTDLLQQLKNQNFNIKVNLENSVKANSISSIKRKAVSSFSDDHNIKAFIIQSIEQLKNTGTEYPRSAWTSEKVGNKLILYNLCKVPTGNYLFSKYSYIFNYHEFELSKTN
jgi:hypothetical protein